MAQGGWWRWGIAAAAALAVGIFATSACTAPKAPEGKTLVEFWDFPRLPAVTLWMEESIKEFERQNPDVVVRYTRLSWSKGGERLDIAAFAQRPPDVAGAVLQLKYAEAGLLEPLDKYIDEPTPEDPTKTYRQDIHPGILKDMQWDGKTYGFPWYKEGFVILLNNDILRERGVAPPPKGQWTWDEFLAAMHRLTFDRDGDGKIDVYGIGLSTGKDKWESYSFLFAEGMELLSADGRKAIMDSDATRRGMQRLLDLEFKEKVSMPGAGGIQDDTTWAAFIGSNRSLAATCQGLWAINAARVNNEKVRKLLAEGGDPGKAPKPLDYSVALFPKMPGQPQRMGSYGPGSLVVFKRIGDPKRTEAAARFARFLTLEAGQKINREAGLLPSRISTGNLFVGDPDYENIAPYLADAVSPPIHPAWPQVSQVVGQYLQLILLQRVDSTDAAITEMNRRSQMILDDYWESRDAAKK